jgi:macrophage erythroblast attacher
VDIKLFAELIRIERALEDKQSVTEALAWCGENRGTLKKTKVGWPRSDQITLNMELG